METNQKLPRRYFIKQISAFGIAGSLPNFIQAASAPKKEMEWTEQKHTFLFQGDSITDGNRSRNTDWNHVMGHGYQYLIAAKLWYELPKKRLHFFNRGISGNNLVDLAARWNDDTLLLKPDVLSILVGINDTEAFIKGNEKFSVEQYQKNYNELLRKTKQLPGVQLVLCEPFILPVGRVKENLATYEKEIRLRQQVVKKLAGKFNAVFVPFQSAFNKALQKAPPEYWIWDGIHPMPAGHELMAREWLKQVTVKLSFLK
jgi:lysophospholipase L1-like esterase